VSEPYCFTSTQHFFANYYNHLIEKLTDWGSKLPELASYPSDYKSILKPLIMIFDVVYLQKFMNCPMLLDNYEPNKAPARNAEGHR